MTERIVVNPGVHFGKPCIAGTRIPVQSVLELVREGVAFNDILRDYYPDLDADDLRACVQYAIDVVAAEDIHAQVETGIAWSRPQAGNGQTEIGR